MEDEKSILLALPEPDSADELTISELITALDSPASDERANAALKLGRLGVAALEAVPPLRTLAAADSDDSVRACAREALFNIHGSVPLDGLLAF